MMMPSTVKVGGQIYSIEMVPRDYPGDWDGHTDHNAGTIHVRQGFAPDVTANTVAHEIEHCIYQFAGLRKDDPEERVVNAGTNARMAVMRDNPELFRWLLHCMEGKEGH